MPSLVDKTSFYTDGDRAVYIGNCGEQLQITNTASALVVSLNDELTICNRLSGDSVTSKSFLIPAGAHIAAQINLSNIALYFLDCLGTDLNRLTPQANTRFISERGTCIYADIKNEQQIIQNTQYIQAKEPTKEIAFEMFAAWIDSFPTTKSKPDARVEKAARLIELHSAENIPVETVAAKVGLSVPRLSQLFKQVTGIPIRRYRLWCRTLSASVKLQEGYPLTESAFESGFSDHPQMTRLFRELTGFKPSSLQNTSKFIYQPVQFEEPIQLTS